jgi:predicted phosphate transport protein (TIGR00153 family)
MGMIKRKKGYDYFACFYQVGELANQSACYLKKAVTDFHCEEIEAYAADMHWLENRADAKRHELCNSLAREFMPPIEREDISLLSRKLDNIVDSVEDVMRKLYMFRISEICSEAIEFAGLVAECCQVFLQLLSEFPNYKKSETLRGYIIDINTLENKGDKLHARSIRRLFSEDATAVNQLAWTKIFDSFETCLDSCEDAADIIDSIITKNT